MLKYILGNYNDIHKNNIILLQKAFALKNFQRKISELL